MVQVVSFLFGIFDVLNILDDLVDDVLVNFFGYFFKKFGKVFDTVKAKLFQCVVEVLLVYSFSVDIHVLLQKGEILLV